MALKPQRPARGVLGDLSVAQFLARHWQQSPLVVRNALPGFVDPLSPEELAGLACEDDSNSRLIRVPRQREPWAMRYGPFVDDDFLSLADSHWTLLVQDVDKVVPEVFALIDHFRFVPDWRIDDVMVSYAAPSGTVGPHWDNYDVFLLQGLGRRRWQISRQPTGALLDKSSELRIMADFVAEDEWLLEPGDMLYLPPGVAHYGVATEPCLTYSIGFRAPTIDEFATAFLDYLLAANKGDRYRDPAGLAPQPAGLLSDAVVEQVHAILLDALGGWKKDTVGDWLGEFVTDPETGVTPEDADEWTLPRLRAYLAEDGTLTRSPGLRMAFRELPEAGRCFYCAGRRFPLDSEVAGLASVLCGQTTYHGAMLLEWVDRPQAGALLLGLVNSGWLYDE